MEYHEIVILVCISVLFIVVTSFAGNIYNVVRPPPEDAPSIQSLQILSNAIEEMLDSDSDYENRIVPITLRPEYAILGVDSRISGEEKIFTSELDADIATYFSAIQAKEQCPSQNCLCLLEKEKTVCNTIDHDVKFFGPVDSLIKSDYDRILSLTRIQYAVVYLEKTVFRYSEDRVQTYIYATTVSNREDEEMLKKREQGMRHLVENAKTLNDYDVLSCDLPLYKTNFEGCLAKRYVVDERTIYQVKYNDIIVDLGNVQGENKYCCHIFSEEKQCKDIENAYEAADCSTITYTTPLGEEEYPSLEIPLETSGEDKKCCYSYGRSPKLVQNEVHPCRNGIKDDGEEDIDCGGPCPSCTCETNDDCVEGKECRMDLVGKKYCLDARRYYMYSNIFVVSMDATTYSSRAGPIYSLSYPDQNAEKIGRVGRLPNLIYAEIEDGEFIYENGKIILKNKGSLDDLKGCDECSDSEYCCPLTYKCVPNVDISPDDEFILHEDKIGASYSQDIYVRRGDMCLPENALVKVIDDEPFFEKKTWSEIPDSELIFYQGDYQTKDTISIT